MTKYLYDKPESGSLWQSDILDIDLEKQEFDKNFANSDVYNSIIDEEPVYHSLMNFPEDEEDALYVADESEADDRNSYKDADKDNIYYFI